MSKGKNIYEEVYSSFGAANESAKLANFSGSADNPCIFLSHQNDDKPAVKAIGEYIRDAGINIYLDADDAELIGIAQTAAIASRTV